MRIIHILIAIFIAFIWGTNFVAIKLSYESFTPFSLLFVRFTLCVFPLIFFIPKPKTSWKNIFLIALFLWIGQFSFLFVGMYLGASAGLTSLILQSQTIFTVILSIFWVGYRPRTGELIGLGIAAAGIIGIAYERFTGGSWQGLALMIPAAICVSISNMLFANKKQTNDNPLSLIVWSSIFPIVPMFAASMIFEGSDALVNVVENLTYTASGAILYTIIFSTLIATSLWAHLLRLHNPSEVVPYTLLVPIFGMVSSMIVLGESYTMETIGFGLAVIAGLGINQWSRKRIPKQPLRKIS